MLIHPASPPKSSLRVPDNRLVAVNSYVLSFEAERFYRGWPLPLDDMFRAKP